VHKKKENRWWKKKPVDEISIGGPGAYHLTKAEILDTYSGISQKEYFQKYGKNDDDNQLPKFFPKEKK
jgi:hypothetical protein